jgi:hypothetical protein
MGGGNKQTSTAEVEGVDGMGMGQVGPSNDMHATNKLLGQ